mgnify:CR=1 FL=1
MEADPNLERNNDNLDLVLIGGGQLEIPKKIKNYS